MNRSAYVLRCSLVAALGGLLFGFDTAVISGTTESLQELFHLSDGWLGFTVASALIGTILGSIIVGRPADRFGRRNMLMVMGILYFVSALGSALAWDWGSFLGFRFIGGLGVGGASVLSPMYIAEISPAKSRGRLVALAQFNIVFGIMLAYLSNYVISTLGFGDIQWRWMFGVEAIPAILFFLLMIANPYSPRWLMSRGRIDEARITLARLDPDTAEDELTAIQESLDLDHHALGEAFYQKKYLMPIMLAVAIAFFNQASGINAVLYYAPRIFTMAGALSESAMLQSVIIGVVMMIFTMTALLVIDRMGRKKLMVIGSIGYIVSLATVAWTFFIGKENFSALGGNILLGAIIVFIASHSFGQGAVIWVFISEIFPNRVRARGQALGSFTHWFFAALISQTFPLVAGKFGAGTIFSIYAVMMVLQLIWVIRVMPETKGIPLEEIQKRLKIE